MQQETQLFGPTLRQAIIWTIGLLLLAFSGCARRHYQQRADLDSYNILHEKASCRPWDLPDCYTINVDPRSRLFDPSNPNDPMLPHPGPHLYCYQLPQFSQAADAPPENLEVLPPPMAVAASKAVPAPADETELVDRLVQFATATDDQPPTGLTARKIGQTVASATAGTSAGCAELSPAERDCAVRPTSAAAVVPARFEAAAPAANTLRLLPAVYVDDEVLIDDGIQAPAESAPSQPPYADTEEGLTIQPIPEAYWNALPPTCLSRMLEFESVREEYRRTFDADPPEELRDPSPKLTFENIVELAYLNSREYQRQKEILYSTALALSLERYDYMCKFSTFGNGVDVNYDHIRTDGTTVNTLGVPSSLQSDRMVALGGTFVTRFANNVLLTFNGPQGFAQDVSSNLLFEFTQSVFQRDVLLEPLIQSERNVVYAARSFARFRKQFFFSLAQTYYNDQLGTYRGIEIDTQNYFAFVRALDQANAEVTSGVGDAPPRVQMDQIEQDMLAGRSRLISTCNSLETRLDTFKLTLGLPTETPINIDLQELESLTRRDEIEVAGELVRRAREGVVSQLSAELPDREEIVSASIVFLERTLAWQKLRQQIGQEGADDQSLRVLQSRLRVDEAYAAVDREQQLLAVAKQPPAVPISVFRSTMSLVQARLGLVARQLQLSDELAEDTEDREEILANFIVLTDRTNRVLERVQKFLHGDRNEDLAALQPDSETLLSDLEGLDATARRMVHVSETRPDAQAELQQATMGAHQLLDAMDQLASDTLGLTPVDLSADDAMVTALVQRFDLMNERGFLADDWRNIKLAADELKSYLNLNVRQSFQTRDNQPFAFSFDDSRTELGASLDLPLNRRQQRNGFKQSLINYQVSRRSLMASEDTIKFDVRQDLRQLDVDRVQYEIAVISAALASERVYSTQLELALGLGSTKTRDFLEAQRAFRESVIRVAGGRLGYIVRRAQLAFDLELMMLDDEGMWPELNNEDYQPKPNPIYPFDADPTYGELPHGVWPSKKIKRMRYVPTPGYHVIGVEPPVDSEGRAASEDWVPGGELMPTPME